MTENKKFKQIVRARMRDTGESYTRARNVLLARANSPQDLASEDAWPRFVEIEFPFPAGWYFYDAQYPDEGSVGPFANEQEARENARLQEYDPDDEDAVRFVEQKEHGLLLQRYDADHLRADPAATLGPVAEAVQALLAERLASVVQSLDKDGVQVPAPGDIGVEVVAALEGSVRARIRVADPRAHQDFVRELADAGILDPRHLASTSLVK